MTSSLVPPFYLPIPVPSSQDEISLCFSASRFTRESFVSAAVAVGYGATQERLLWSWQDQGTGSAVKVCIALTFMIDPPSRSLWLMTSLA